MALLAQTAEREWNTDMTKIISICLLLSGLVACGVDNEAYSQQSSAIINGTLVNPDQQGHVNWGGCSGTLLTNSWILSAKHCFADQNPEQPDYWRLVAMGSQAAAMKKIYLHPTLDVAIAKLVKPMQMRNSTSGYQMGLYQGVPERIVGKDLNCFGYGDQAFTGAQDGLLRTAILTVDRLQPLGQEYICSGVICSYAVVNNADGQIIYFGDSGGGCFYNVPGGNVELAGIHVAVSPGGSVGFDAASWGFAAWAKAVMASN